VGTEPKTNGLVSDDLDQNDIEDYKVTSSPKSRVDETKDDASDRAVTSPKCPDEAKEDKTNVVDCDVTKDFVEAKEYLIVKNAVDTKEVDLKNNNSKAVSGNESPSREMSLKKKRRKRKVKDYPWGQIKKKKKKLDVSLLVQCFQMYSVD